MNCSLVGYTLWTFISDSLEGSNTYLLNATDSVCIIEYDGHCNSNILNPFTLLDPHISHVISLIITIASISLSFIISWHFFESYRFSGFGYLLGLPVGFIFIASSIFV